MAVALAGTLVQNSRELVALYKNQIRRLGFTGRAMFYASEDAHSDKLRTHAKALDRHAVGGAAVLDLGCGYGELLRHYCPPGPYVGVDMVPEFVAEARRRYPAREFILGDVLSVHAPVRSDWVVLAGVLSSVPEPAALLSAAAGVARAGLVFDITLTERLPVEFKELNRLSRAEVLQALETTGLEIVEVEDIGSSWILFVCARREGVPRAIGSAPKGPYAEP